MMNTTATTCIRRLIGLFALSLLCVGLFSATPARAQDGEVAGLEECAGGTLYLVAFPDTTTNTYDNRFPAQLLRTKTTAFSFYVYSPVAQTVRVGRYAGAGNTYSIAAGEIKEIPTETIGVPLVTVINTAQTNVLKIESEFPIVVYGYMMTAFGCEAYTAIPVESWGTEYYASAWPGENLRDVFPNGEFNYRAVPKQGEAEILIIAAYDNTQVRISPRAVLRDCNSCQTVTLKAGEAYLVQSTTDTNAGAEKQPDLSGTMIQASKRIGVISGNPRVMHNKGVRPSLGENSFMNMAIEWIPPAEQHGTQFVEMPTWDDRRQRDGLDLEESRDQELVRVYGTHEGETEVSWRNDLGVSVPGTKTPVLPQELSDEKIGVPVARLYETSQPAMAFSSPHAVVKFNGTTTYGANYVGAAYKSWSTYMVELIPREQWTSFAPVKAPSLPSSMVHYMNLVTDTNHQYNVYYRQGSSSLRQLFPFNRGKVPGSDLVWGSITLNKGVDYFIEGEKGAVFTGDVYGSYGGQEQYRPGATKKKDDKGSSVAGGGSTGEDPTVLHPSEYEEDVALMYGYPLAPSRCVLAPPDEYEITTKQECEVMDITIKAKNNPASGIRSITMLPDSSENVRLEFIDPSNPLDLKSTKVVEAKLRLVAIDPTKNAHAVIIIKDRTRASKRWRVEYTWEAEKASFNPSDEVDFGQVTINQEAGDKVVTITNPLDKKDIVIKRLSFVLGTEGFVIKRTDPAFDWASGNDSVVLKPGDSLRVWINITPTVERRYLDSLRLQLGCVILTLPVKAATAIPCLYVSDLDFKTMNVGESRELPLQICNTGKGTVTFQDPWLTWLTTEFSVKQTEIDKLKGLTLKENECVTITVKFTAPADSTGQFRTTGRFWADTRDCRDTSIWKANVIKPGPQITGYDWEKRWVSENPCTKNPDKDYRSTIQVKNAGNSPFEIVEIKVASETDPDDVFSIGATNATPGLVMQPDAFYDVEVIFDPKIEKVYYSPEPAKVRMLYKINVDGKDVIDSVENTLEGIGIESYAEVTDQSFGKIEFKQPAGTSTVSSSVTITAKGTRPVTITNVTINPGADFKLVNAWTPVTLDPENPGNNSVVVPVDFVPQDATTLLKNATIDLEGDFAYDQCSITDSTGDLDGEVYTLGASVDGFDFGTLLTCYERDGFITVHNLGTDPVQVTNFTQSTDQHFSVDPKGTIVLPKVLAPKGDPNGGDVMQIPVHYTPDVAGSFTGTVDVTVMNADGTAPVAVLQAQLTGKAEKITVNMTIADDYHTFPGLPLEIPVNLDNDPSAAQVTEFIIDLDYNSGMMLLDDVKLGSLFPESDGWKMDVVGQTPGNLTVRIYNTAGRFVSGTGEALKMHFVTFVGENTGEGEKGNIPFNVTPVTFGTNQTPCIDITTKPGHAKVDSVCGLSFRLIEAFSSKYSVGQAVPNVVKTTTDIEFSIGLDAETMIEVFNQNGDKVGVLVNQYLQPGSYKVTWDATKVPSGKYFYRITSGHWTGTNELIIQK